MALLYLTLLPLLAGIGLAAESSQRSVISVPLRHNSNYKPTMDSIRRAYQKHDMPFPSLFSEKLLGTAFAPSQTKSSDLTWLTPVTINNQTFDMVVDTGSSDLWVFSNATNQTDHETFDCKNPTPGYSWQIAYSDNTIASGAVMFGNVSIGGVHVTNQAIECANQAYGNLDKDASGIIGLGLSATNTIYPEPQKTWLDNAIKEGLIDGVFTVDLYSKNVNQSSYTFGRCTCREPTWVNLTEGGIGTGFYSFPGVNGQHAIADTGTTLLLLRDEDVRYYYKHVPGANYHEDLELWFVPGNITLPDALLPIGQETVRISGEYIKFFPLSDNTKDSWYWGAIQSNTEKNRPQIYGDIFFKSLVVCIDVSKGRMGWCSKNDTTDAPTESGNSPCYDSGSSYGSSSNPGCSTDSSSGPSEATSNSTDAAQGSNENPTTGSYSDTAKIFLKIYKSLHDLLAATTT